VGIYEWELAQGKGVDDHLSCAGPDVVLGEISRVSIVSFDWRKELIRSKPTPRAIRDTSILSSRTPS